MSKMHVVIEQARCLAVIPEDMPMVFCQDETEIPTIIEDLLERQEIKLFLGDQWTSTSVQFVLLARPENPRMMIGKTNFYIRDSNKKIKRRPTTTGEMKTYDVK